jgi:hypothetical protein
MIRLYETATNQLCGTLSDRQYEVLTEGPDLLDILRAALGDRPEVTIRCERS